MQQDSQTAFQMLSRNGDINQAANGGNIRFPSTTSNWNSSSISGSNSENYNNSSIQMIPLNIILKEVLAYLEFGM